MNGALVAITIRVPFKSAIALLVLTGITILLDLRIASAACTGQYIELSLRVPGICRCSKQPYSTLGQHSSVLCGQRRFRSFSAQLIGLKGL